MRKIIEVRIVQNPVAPITPPQQRQFQALCKAISVGAVEIDLNTPIKDLLTLSFTGDTFSRIIERTVIAEGPYVKHVI